MVPWACGKPAWFEMPDGFTWRDAAPLTEEQTKRIFKINDGCCVQHDCCHAFYGTQTWERRTGVKIDSVQHPCSKGKCACDGITTIVRSLTETAARSNKNYASDTLACTEFVTRTLHSREKAKRMARRDGPIPKDNALTGMLLAFCPDNGSGFRDCKVNKGHKGSDLDCCCAGLLGEDGAPDGIITRNAPCACNECLQGRFAFCKVPWSKPRRQNQLQPWSNAATRRRIEPKRPEAKRISNERIAQ